MTQRLSKLFSRKPLVQGVAEEPVLNNAKDVGGDKRTERGIDPYPKPDGYKAGKVEVGFRDINTIPLPSDFDDVNISVIRCDGTRIDTNCSLSQIRKESQGRFWSYLQELTNLRRP